MHHEINEPIGVFAFFAKGKVRREKVERGKSTYEVNKINNVWRQKAGSAYNVCFSVETDMNTRMVILLDPSELSA